MSATGRPQHGSEPSAICGLGSHSVCLCGGHCKVNSAGGENSSKGKAKAIHPFTTEDEYVGDTSGGGLRPELDILWRTASAAQQNRIGHHKSRFASDSSRSESSDHGSRPVRWPYDAERSDIPFDDSFAGVVQDQRTHRYIPADEDFQNAFPETRPSRQESSSMDLRDVQEQPWYWEARDDHPSWEGAGGAPEEMIPSMDDSNSDDEILIPRRTNTRGWQDRESWSSGAGERTAQKSKIARVTRGVSWAEEAAVWEQYVVFGSNLVACAAGLDIRKIVPGFNLCSIMVKNLPAGTTVPEVADIVLQQGVPTSDFSVAQVYNVGSKCEAEILVVRRYGQTVVVDLKGIEFHQHVLTAEVADFTPQNSMTSYSQSPSLSVSWDVINRPLVATYHSPEEALRRARELNGMIWNGRRLRVSVIESHPRASILHSVKIANPPDHAETDFEFCCLIGTLSVQPSRGTFCNYLESLSVVYEYLWRQNGVLTDTFEVFSVDIDGQATVQVNFDTWENVQRAYASVHNSRPGFGSQAPKLRAYRPDSFKHQHSSSISKRQYLAQRRLWDTIREGRDEVHEGVAGMLIEEGDDTVAISVVGEDQKATGALKVRVERLIAGEALDMACWHPSFLLHESEPFFDRIYDQIGVFARADFGTLSLRVYGEPGMIEHARHLVEEEVQRLRNITMTKPLRRGTAAFFVKEGIGRLKELIGEENVALDLSSRPCTITVKGGEEASHHLQRLIEESVLSNMMDIAEESLCPVCYTQPSNPEHLGCGHSYCAGCLNHFLSSTADSKNFPIVCLGNEATCGSAFPIPFLRRFLPHQAFQRLLEAAFTCCIEQHPHEYRCCPTVDCKQVYRRQQHPTPVQCPSCFLSICPACAEESHGNLTCEESHFQRDPAMQEIVNEQLGFKKCPQCQSWIEKAGGCNHLRCGCGAHICWRCMGVFSAGEIYAHMNGSHGGIHGGEQLPPGLDVGGVPAGDFIAQQINELAWIEMERDVAGQRRVDFLQPAQFPPYDMIPLDELEMMERRRALAEPVQERRRLIAEAQAFYARRLEWLRGY